MKLAYSQNYDMGGSPNIAHENDLLGEEVDITVVPIVEDVPRLENTDPIDVEALGVRTVRGFSLASEMVKFH